MDWVRARRGWVAIAIGLYAILGGLLSGCLDYGIEIQFSDANHGAIVQHIRVGDRLTALGDEATRDWLADLSRRTRQLGGRVRRRSPTALDLILPATNGRNLTHQFEAFFVGIGDRPNAPLATAESLQFPTYLDLQQRNYGVTVRNRLHYEVDLRGLALFRVDDKVILGSGTTLNLTFALTAPQVRVSRGEGLLPADNSRGYPEWHLEPGQINRLEAVFWTPSWIGIGAIAIAGWVVVSLYWHKLGGASSASIHRE